jgi:hypothetical protein
VLAAEKDPVSTAVLSSAHLCGAVVAPVADGAAGDVSVLLFHMAGVVLFAGRDRVKVICWEAHQRSRCSLMNSLP